MSIDDDPLHLAMELAGVSAWNFELTGAGDVALPPGVMPDDEARVRAGVRACVDGMAPRFEAEFRVRDADGAVRWKLGNGAVRRDDRGRPLRFTGAIVDITRVKDAEAETRAAKERLDEAMKLGGLAVFEMDLRGLPDPGTALVQRSGLHLELPSTLGMLEHMRAAVVPEDQPRMLELLDATLYRGAAEQRIEFRAWTADGGVGWRANHAKCFYDEHGAPVRILGVSYDIQNLKSAQEEAQRAREAAESANRSKDEFLANVSHEIRTPMNAVLGMTQLAIDLASDAHQRELLSTVRSAARNLLRIIDDLLDYSKVASGMLALDRADFSLRAVVEDTVNALAVQAQGKGLVLRSDVRSDVPDAVAGDPGRVRQVLTNLVGNAIKFTQRGEVDVDVAVDAAAAPAAADSIPLVFTVRDTGIGIAPDKQAAIFRAFEQGDASTTRHYGGTGLGLTIAAQLARLMDGAITVESAPGSGSTFRFTARVARSARAVVVPEPAPPPGSVGPAPRSLRVLVAEDNELNVALLRALLDRRGHRARFARDGITALQLALEGELDVLLLDLHMPELDGFEVVRAIRAHERRTGTHLRVIALTARSSAADRERCLAAGMDDFLPKPIEADALWAAIDRLVAEPAVVDAHAILRATRGEPAIVDKLRAVLHRTLPDQVAQVRAALDRGDLPALRGAAHQLLGTVGPFSTITAEAAAALEDAALREDRAQCPTLADRLASLCDALLAATAD
jgi:two-component system sensor histidine kinase/response regulator